MNKEIINLENKIRHHKAMYYAGSPEISDIEFDKLEEELRLIDPDNPVLNLVGSEINSSDKVQHETKMLSLGKTYALDELLKWAEGKDVLGIYKVDGVSCSIIYDKGRLKIAKTRGDGKFGENITNKVHWMQGVPQKINSLDKIEIRGEMYCDEENFIKLSKRMVEMGLAKPSSLRNIVAGLVGRKDHLELCEFLNFKAFEVIGLEVDRETKKYTFLNENNFDSLEFRRTKTQKDFEELIAEAKAFLSEGSYLIDGLVFIYDDLSLHKELGETAHHPRYKMAFKFQGETQETTLKGITWQVSRNGILTPVGEVEPVEISGAVVSRVTLHNYGMVEQNNLKTGDRIEIVRSGEVIPKFLSVIKASNNEFTIPRLCPSCEEETTIVDIRLMCLNKSCTAQVKETILNFIQKIGIDDLSSKRLDVIIKNGLIENIEDVYDLTVEQLVTIDKIQEKLANKIIDSIEKSKNTSLTTFLASLGITGGAYNKCEKVVSAGYNTIEKINNLTAKEIFEIEGFAEKSSNDFYNSLESKKIIIEGLIKKGFNFEEINTEELPLKNMKICITGSLSEKRSNVEAKIRELGGSIVGSVSKNTSILLTNETEAKSSKYKKALDLNIKIISEEELNNMMR